MAWLGVPTQTKDSSVSRIASDWIARSAQPAGLGSGCDDFTDICFNDRRLPAIDQVDFGRERVDANDFMSIIGEASRRNCADISQSENANSHTYVLKAAAFPVWR